ncbi:hypothetical protein [Pleomorphomonas sp. NRK KF1]|uniref:hypothetical protein n=1 Tax=Pleomorphomonas sp. NRK KF1 TaxID=2943000 RepID=UPI0020433994|nr:hypothetical protein [Pleomorphomonas sp. NRK KF1]MCM5552400.1 hypothetical protein [Pleomorphomonas sp. NRK KF1]
MVFIILTLFAVMLFGGFIGVFAQMIAEMTGPAGCLMTGVLALIVLIAMFAR